MTTEAPTAGTSAPETGAAAPASPGTLLTPPAAPPAADPHAQAASPPADPNAAPSAAVDKPDDQGKPADPPAEYADFTAPEGVTFDPEALTEFKALAKEKGLSQDDAQKFTDLGAKLMQKHQQAYVSQIEQAQAQWAEASRTDKEFGGDKLAENVALAQKAREAFGSPELFKILDESGLGNHPEFVRVFYRVGKAISEDRLVPGAKRNTESDRAKRMFPSMT